MKTEYKKLIKNTGLLAIGSFATSLLGLLMIPFYTSVLSTTDYGISDLITVTSSLLFPFVSLAISEAILRFSLDKDADWKTIYSGGLWIIIIGLTIVLLFLPLVKKTAIGNYTWYFFLYFCVYCLHTITSYFVKGLEKIHTYSIAGVLNSTIVIGCNLLFLLYLKWGINGYLLSFILGHFVTFLFMFFRESLYKYITFPKYINKDILKKMLVYSLPIIPNGISWWIANSSDKYILTHYASVSDVGIYAVSYKIPTIMMTVMGFFVASWQLSSVEDFGTERSKSFFSGVYDKYVMISIILASLLIVTAKPFASFLYSKDFFTAWHYVPILIIANVFNIMATFMGTVYTGAKKTAMLSISTVIGAVVNISLNFILIPIYGAIGAAVATAISYLVMYVIRIIHTRTIMAFPINHSRDITFYCLLLVQSICVLSDTKIGIIIAIIICIILMFICRSFILNLVNSTILIIKDKFISKTK